MNFKTLRTALLWCTVINYAVLAIWFIVFVFAHETIYLFHRRWFHISTEQFDMLHYIGMSIYKIGILLFNLVPWIARSKQAIRDT